VRIEKVTLKNGAVLVSDVHYRGEKEFLEFLNHLNNNPPTQLFLLGDIFHLLLPFKYLVEFNRPAIELIDKISRKCEVYYTNGNHDFNLEGIFHSLKHADAFVDEEKSIFLTHGDLTDRDFFYKIYVRIIRSKLLNRVLNVLSLNFLNGWLFKKIMQKKVKCEKILNFKAKIKSKIADINYKIIVEGHYHQNETFVFENKKYINLGAFVCDGSYYVYENEFKGFKWKTKH